jgi:diguanylate cyclase (GGDEF)-like protein
MTLARRLAPIAVAALVLATITQAEAASAVQEIATRHAQPIAPPTTIVNPRAMAGMAGIIVGVLLLVLYFYRQRLYILYWTIGWLLLSLSMFVAAPRYAVPSVGQFAYGLSQLLAIAGALIFVVSSDAYEATPRLRKGHVFLLLPLFIWFTLSPLALDSVAVFAPGHLLVAGGMAAAGVAHLNLGHRLRLVGAGVVGTMFLLQAALNVWIAFAVAQPDDVIAGRAIFVTLVLYLVTALGMQAMTFEDMTYELRRTNKRLESAQDELRQMVTTDPLTGCRNRRFFDEIIGREVNRHRRYDIPMSLLFIDVDKFKAVNDMLGHEAGDRVLQHVAAFLVRKVREADYVFRWGGDEFLILLACREQEALRKGAELKEGFARETAPLPTGVGLSIGCVELGPDDDVYALVKVADERMYADKRRGRS